MNASGIFATLFLVTLAGAGLFAVLARRGSGVADWKFFAWLTLAVSGMMLVMALLMLEIRIIT